MTTLLVILWGIFVIALVVVLAIHPERTRHSWFELKRNNDDQAMRRERLLGSVLALRRLIVVLLTAGISIIAVLLWQWWGALVSLIGILFMLPIARSKTVRQPIMHRYKKYEAGILDFAEKWPIIGWFMREERFSPHDLRLESVEQLLHLVDSSGHVLSEDQQTILRHGLDWHKTPVRSIMTPKKDIVSIKHTELLGPLVLDDLHRSGHSRFPVIRGSLDSVIGVLDITELLDLTAGKVSQTAEKSMSSQALRIAADESLPAVLAMLQKSHQHLLVVIDEDGKTVGLVTLSDITGSLLGK